MPDEAHFDLHANVKRQNSPSDGITSDSLSSEFIVGSYFFEENGFNGESYLQMLKELPFNSLYFQEASPVMTEIPKFLIHRFRRTPHSVDFPSLITKLHYTFLWGNANEKLTKESQQIWMT